MLDTTAALQNILAGGLSGMTVDFVLFPLDTIKTRLQTRKQLKKLNAVEAAHVAVKTVKNQSFYRGLTSAMLGSFPSAATFWTSYETAKSIIEPALAYDNNGQVQTAMLPVAHMMSAALADIAVCAVRNPFEVVKQQMQAGLHKTTMEAVKTIIRVDGVQGLFAGYFSTVMREIPFDAIEFALYEWLKRQLRSYRERDLVLWENCLLGSTAGAFAAGITTPLDVIKTRLMTQTRTDVSDRYLGVMDAFRRIRAEEGVPALFSGIKPRVLWIGLGGTIFFGTYEEAKRRLTSTQTRSEW